MCPLYNLTTIQGIFTKLYLNINIRRLAKCKNHNSCINTVWIICLGISLVNINVCWMYNTIWHQKGGRHLCFCRKTNSSYSCIWDILKFYHSLGWFSRWQIAFIFFYFSQKIRFDANCLLRRHCMKCQSQFSGKDKKNIWKCMLKFLSSMLSIKIHSWDFQHILLLRRNINLKTGGWGVGEGCAVVVVFVYVCMCVCAFFHNVLCMRHNIRKVLLCQQKDQD